MSSSTRPEPSAPVGSVGPAWTAWGAGDAGADALPDARYEHGGELGRGGMGVVRVAVDAWLDREVALKRPHADLDAAARERLVREARITARLDHPGIVPVLDFGVDADGPFYTMPVLVGTTLAAALEAAQGASPGAWVRELVAVSRAVAFAHARGVVHRDLKPANILIGAWGEVRVLDWGVALDPGAPDAHAVGTTGFQPPEQRDGVVVGPAADVYALGRTLAAVLDVTGAPPALAAVVERACATEPAARYPEAGAFADELERWLDGRRVEAHEYTAWEALSRVAALWRGPLLLAGLVVMLGVGLATAWATTLRWERDRALAAEEASRAARVAADTNLAAALWQAASSFLLADMRPAAEVLAARSLQLADTPRARGVMMAWHGLPRPEPGPRVPLPCGSAELVDEAVLCFEADRAWLVDGSVERWRVDAAGLAPIRVARSDGHLAVLIHQGNAVSVWRDGRKLRDVPGVQSALEPAGGDVFAVRDNTRVGRFRADGATEWSAPLCDRVADAWVDGDRIAAVCAPDLLVTASFGGAVARRTLGHPPSAVAMVGPEEVVVGTFDGHLLAASTGFTAETSGVGAVQRLTPWGEAVVVEGEALPPHLWDPRTGLSVARFPRRGRAVAGAQLWLVDADRQRWEVPEPAGVARLTRGGGGGLSFLALSPSGDGALGGNSSGAVTRWDLTTGAPTTVARGCLNAARAGALFARTAVAVQLGCEPIGFERDWRTGEEGERIIPGSTRLIERWGDNLVLGTYTERVELVVKGQTTDVRGWFEAIAVGDDDVWLLTRTDEVGLVVGDEFEARFRVEGATGLARAAGVVYVLAGDSVGAYDPDSGALRWRWTGTASLTAVAAASSVGSSSALAAASSVGSSSVLAVGAGLVVVGDMDGGISVIGGDGTLLATARGHRRRVSAVRAVGERVYSASWDGTVRGWDLGVVGMGVEEVVDGVEGWGVTAEEVVAGGMPF